MPSQNMLPFTVNPDETMFSYKFGTGLIAAAFIIWGLHTMINPKAMAVPHFAERYASPFTEFVPRDTSRIYGILSLVMGLGLLRLATYPDK